MLKPILTIVFAIGAILPLCAQNADFDLTIAVPKVQTTGPGTGAHAVIYDKTGKRPFHVLLTKRSGKAQRLWVEWCSWGYYNLSFEFNDSTSKTWMVRREDIAFTANAPGWFTLEPGETHVFSVTFPSGWLDLPEVPRGPVPITLRAIYEIPPDGMTQRGGVWTGKVISNPVQVQLFPSK